MSLRDPSPTWIGPTTISLRDEGTAPAIAILAAETSPRRKGKPLRRWLSAAVGLLSFLAAGFCFWQSGWTPGNAAGLHATVLSPSRAQKPTGPYQTKRIADIVPMDWVLAGNPKNEFDLQFGEDVDPEEWRLLTLVAPKKNGGTADVRMIRPAAWLDLQWLAQQPEPVSEFICLAPLERRLTGKTIPIHVPECGIEGDAQILSIEPCPSRRPRPGPEYRLVTATYRHHNAEVLDVYIDGEKEPIGSTPNHPFWSADLQKFVRADALHPGEHLQKADGSFTSVRRLVPRRGTHDVFNLEVQVDHVYHVAKSGVLVHNSKPCDETLERFGSLAEAMQANATQMLHQRPGHNTFKRLAILGEIDPGKLGTAKSYSHRMEIKVGPGTIDWLRANSDPSAILGHKPDKVFAIPPNLSPDFNNRIKSIQIGPIP